MTDTETLASMKRTLANFVTWGLIGGGALLLLVGAMLAYPYIHSRLAAPASASVVTPSARCLTVRPSPSTSHIARMTALTRMATPSLAPTPVPESASPAVNRIPTPQPRSLQHSQSPTRTLQPGSQDDPAAPPTRIVIPAIGVDAPVIPVSRYTLEVAGRAQMGWNVPDRYAAGWHETSAPLGRSGNTVLNGHNTTNGEVFRDLYTLRPGDVVIVYSEETSYTYTVSQTLILPEAGQPLEVRRSNARYIMPTEDERLTLVTCHPYGSLRNRLIVIARPVQSRSSRP